MNNGRPPPHPLDQAAADYAAAGADWLADLARYLRHGWIFGGRDFIVLARPVRLDAWRAGGEWLCGPRSRSRADACFVKYAAGRGWLTAMVRSLPWPELPRIAWQREFRGSSELRIMETERLLRWARRLETRRHHYEHTS